MPPQDSPTRTVLVWDLPVRLFHWVMALLFAVLWISGDTGQLDVHITTGLLMLTLLVFRVAWGLVGSTTARFSSFVRTPAAVLAYLRQGRASGVWSGLGHNPLGGWSVTVLISLLLAQSVFGLFTTDDIATDGPLVAMVSSATVKSLSSLHRLGAWVLLGLAALHIAAILYYRVAKNEDLISPMIGGEATVDAQTAEKSPPLVMAQPQRAIGYLVMAALLVYGGLAIFGS